MNEESKKVFDKEYFKTLSEDEKEEYLDNIIIYACGEKCNKKEA